MILPGIGGSELTAPDGERVWRADRGSIANLFLRPERLAQPGLQAVGLTTTKTLTPIGGSIDGYEDLVTALGARFSPGRPVDTGGPHAAHLDARVVAFPYDFRASIVESAQHLDWEVDRRLDALGWTGEPDRVVVIGHSMGGLVARQWVAQGTWERCRAVITLGTPYAGAPKALDCLVNGLLPWWLGRWRSSHDLIREWPGVHELAPQYRSVADVSAPAGTAIGSHPADLGFPGIARRLGEAARVHATMNAAWAVHMSETACHAYRGRRHPTLLQASWDGRSLRSSKRPPSWIDGEDASEGGDGTVPTIAAIPFEQHRHLAPPPVSERHGPMVAAARCIEALDVLLSEAPAVPHGMRSTEPSIGLDLADAYPADEPVEVAAEILPEKYGAQPDIALTYVLRRSGPRGDVVGRGAMTSEDGARWSARIPRLDEDDYWLTVSETGTEIAPSVSDWLTTLDRESTT